MNQNEILEKLQDEHYVRFLRVRTQVFKELSEQQGPNCCCGEPAKGIHESLCDKFNNKVNEETINRLKHLLK